ncbi:NUMOD4 domain-containing protein [Peribacillus castrilensis]|uniref:NUMOD4 domain-containing protein n=1 Tax=Peribacillus castrilensis TaxID=2897690 RepID=UPI003D29C679
MIYLYDPRTNILTETSYSYLSELTGKNKGNLATLKSIGRKISNINCYLTDENLTKSQRKAWYEKEKYHNETWKFIQGSNEKFLISNYGRFKRVYKNKVSFLLPYLNKRRGYQLIKVKFNDVYNEYRIANLVAIHFVGSPKTGEVLHHKNLIKTDNYSGNLEYISKQDLGKKTGQLSSSKPVVQLDKDTKEVIDEFRSAREAGRQCFLSYQAVLDNCNHKSKSSGGYHFMFLDEYERVFLGSSL